MANLSYRKFLRRFPCALVLQLMRGVIGMQLRYPQRFESLLTAVFTALWAHGANLNDRAVTAATLAKAGFDPAEVFGLANDADIKAALAVHRAST